jgi:hypothetical protein
VRRWRCPRQFRPEYRWIDTPVAGELGLPLGNDGASKMLPGRLYVCGPCVDFAAAAEADPGGRPPADLPEYSGVLATACIRLLL